MRGEGSFGQIESTLVDRCIGDREPRIGQGFADDISSGTSEKPSHLIYLGLKLIAFLGPGDLHALHRLGMRLLPSTTLLGRLAIRAVAPLLALVAVLEDGCVSFAYRPELLGVDHLERLRARHPSHAPGSRRRDGPGATKPGEAASPPLPPVSPFKPKLFRTPRRRLGCSELPGPVGTVVE